MRLIIFSVGLITVIFGTAFIGLFPGGRLKRWMNEKLMKVLNKSFFVYRLFRSVCELVHVPSLQLFTFMTPKTRPRVEVNNFYRFQLIVSYF